MNVEEEKRIYPHSENTTEVVEALLFSAAMKRCECVVHHSGERVPHETMLFFVQTFEHHTPQKCTF